MLTLQTEIKKRFGTRIPSELDEKDKIIRYMTIGEVIVNLLESGYKEVQGPDRVRLRRLSDKIFDAFEASSTVLLAKDEEDLIKRCLSESTYADFIHEKVDRFLEQTKDKKDCIIE